MTRILFKAALVILVVALTGVPNTAALFSDIEAAQENTFTASTLDLAFTSPAANFIPDTIVAGDTTATRNALLQSVGQMPFDYRQEYVYVSGTADLCHRLRLTVKDQTNATVYTGALDGFSLSLNNLASSTAIDYSYSLTLPNTTPGILNGASCQFDFRARAWQVGGVYGSGFFDEEILSNQITAIVDNVSPIISNVEFLIATPGEGNERTATITWNTNEPATSNLDYRICDQNHNNCGSWTSLADDDTPDQTAHTREITALIDERIYDFRVRSADLAANEATSTSYFEIDGTRLGLVPWSNVVINEYLPNPTGADNAAMPEGEWVELYNRSDGTTYNLTNWFLTDNTYSHRLPITLANTTTSDPATTGLFLAPHEFMVVYRNGDSDFSLNNDAGGDAVMLYRPSYLLDLHVYTWLLGDEVLENKSFARIPDGTNNWFDPIPTPGAPNKLAETPDNSLETPVEFTIDGEHHKLSFKISNISVWQNVNYIITYKSDQGEQGIGPSDVVINGANELERKDLTLGTCSTIENKVCVYHQNVTDIKLTITLSGGSLPDRTIEKTIGL